MLKGFLIMLVKDDEAKFKLASEFIKTMPNWAVTDGFEPKFTEARYVDALLKQALGSNLEYEKRFFYVYFMRKRIKRLCSALYGDTKERSEISLFIEPV